MVLLLAHLPFKCATIIPATVCWVGAGGIGGVLYEALRVAF
jgi:tRNA A37 threonylcarbamoyladenosine dehydratase